MATGFRIFSDKHYAYSVTWTLVDWVHLFDKATYRQIFLDALSHIRTAKHTRLNGFVLISSHAHAILWPDPGINLSDVVGDFKRFTSRKISQEAERQNATELLAVFKKARRSNRAQAISKYQVWQEGSHPEAIFTYKFARQKLDYIHMNPVKAGLVETPEQWLYSSARAYLLGEVHILPLTC
jgi:REP element-mobilizing transposase RayT